jgi:hypothetical protein
MRHLKLYEEFINEDIKLSRGDVFSKIEWESSSRDLYPGYDPRNENPDLEEYWFETKEKAEQYADLLIGILEGLPDPVPIYRAVKAEKIEDVDVTDYPGESWSFDLSSALQFGRHNGSNFMMSAKVGKKDVNWAGTIKAYVLFSGGGDVDDENEIVVDDQSAIKDIKVEPITKKMRDEARANEGWFFHMNMDLTSNKPMDAAVEQARDDRMQLSRKTLVEMAHAMFMELGETDTNTKARITEMLDNSVIGTIHTHTQNIFDVLIALSANVPGIKFSEDDPACYTRRQDDASEDYVYDPKNKIRTWFERNRAQFQQMEDDLQATLKQMKHGRPSGAPDWGLNADGTYDVQG